MSRVAVVLSLSVGIVAFALGVVVGQGKYLPPTENLEATQEVVNTETEEVVEIEIIPYRSVYINESGVITNR